MTDQYIYQDVVKDDMKSSTPTPEEEQDDSQHPHSNSVSPNQKRKQRPMPLTPLDTLLHTLQVSKPKGASEHEKTPAPVTPAWKKMTAPLTSDSEQAEWNNSAEVVVIEEDDDYDDGPVGPVVSVVPKVDSSVVEQTSLNSGSRPTPASTSSSNLLDQDNISQQHVPPSILSEFLFFHDEFIEEGAPREVNVPATVRKEASKLCQLATIDRSTSILSSNVFDKVADEVVAMLYRDTFGRYVIKKGGKDAVLASAASIQNGWGVSVNINGSGNGNEFASGNNKVYSSGNFISIGSFGAGANKGLQQHQHQQDWDGGSRGRSSSEIPAGQHQGQGGSRSRARSKSVSKWLNKLRGAEY
ncbi:hypothetical protein HDU76_003521 [Blyttiomyces sp. JEL0837]|nr:hypothetical protein HDU76_003521 [Blyttiomyces sp. JEL0837]